MATLDQLKQALRRSADIASCRRIPLDTTNYLTGFRPFQSFAGLKTYDDFIVPQLEQIVLRLLEDRPHISVLEVGPGQRSVLGKLPKFLTEKIATYEAFEQDKHFANPCSQWLLSDDTSFPGVQTPLVCPSSFSPRNGIEYDLVLFCQSLYGMDDKSKVIGQALGMTSEDGTVVVFHRESLCVEGLACQRTVTFPTGLVDILNKEFPIDGFAPFIAGFDVSSSAVKEEWRDICRSIGENITYPGNHSCTRWIRFSAPETMMVFTRHSLRLSELTDKVPFSSGMDAVKNREARRRHPAAVLRPTDIDRVQECIRWALKHEFGLSIVGGSHSGHCLISGVVGIDMSAFSDIHILETVTNTTSNHSEVLLVAGGGCKAGDIIKQAMDAGVTVPLGSRPSVGSGLWLQGGIGHLTRLHGLSCDAVLGAVVVSPATGDILYVGTVPLEHQPAGSSRPKNEEDLLWAPKGAGNQVAVVISVVFRTVPTYTYAVRSWSVPLADALEPNRDLAVSLASFGENLAGKLPGHCSSDAYIHWSPDSRQIHLGVSLLEALPTATTSLASFNTTEASELAVSTLGREMNYQVVDAVGLFDAEMQMLELSKSHRNGGNGKTSAFKRCVFLPEMNSQVVEEIVSAMNKTPSSLCYLHLLHGGGDGMVAFGCRDWVFACIITGVWPRNQDDTETARMAIAWVYDIAETLLPLSYGAYAADLGPDPRDAELAAAAFGPSKLRLAKIKMAMDPGNVLRYVCPLPPTPRGQRLIIMVTGGRGVGKDYSAEVWRKAFTKANITARVVSISDVTKREYAASSGADLDALLQDRDYKESHRQALTTFYRDQVGQRPRIPEEHFLDAVRSASDVDVVLITGMRDDAPVANFAHLVPDTRVMEVRVYDEEDEREVPPHLLDENSMEEKQDYKPCLEFKNESRGRAAAKAFADEHLVLLFNEDLYRLTEMVTMIPDYPREGIDFRHVLNISQQRLGLRLCCMELQDRFAGSWADINALPCCEAGGLIFATALSQALNIPLALIRKTNKLPPPVLSVPKHQSHISAAGDVVSDGAMFEMGQNVIPKNSSLVIVDDVLATGETLLAVMRLLEKAGVSKEKMNVMVVAEFPRHQGRKMLREHGFGMVRIQSLMVFGGK
ncbi:phosphoribosyl transferase domain protein [Plectosphaerella plurivora]|uniref:Phosphoribosyl transferase domain protein n=1 Tax=Plectosphaerella plurivora TaxID=936078 RepID=A0A9P9AFD8_9PEZI|nr:phosphoribosyl transferase domain protein [Plectosphaerella plurivora]